MHVYAWLLVYMHIYIKRDREREKHMGIYRMSACATSRKHHTINTFTSLLKHKLMRHR